MRETALRQRQTGAFGPAWSPMAALVRYVSALALLAIFGLHRRDQLPSGAVEPAVGADGSVATRSDPAFAISQSDISGKTEAYEILRHCSCRQSTRPAAAPDWVTTTENLRLRGAL